MAVGGGFEGYFWPALWIANSLSLIFYNKWVGGGLRFYSFTFFLHTLVFVRLHTNKSNSLSYFFLPDALRFSSHSATTKRGRSW